MVRIKNRLTHNLRWRLSPFIAAAVTIGLAVALSAYTANPPVAIEPESGTMTAGASVATIGTASGGQAVTFSTAPTPVSTPTPPPNPPGWQLSWSDEFVGSTLDTSSWVAYDPSNGKQRYGSADPYFLPCLQAANVEVSNGNLTLKSKKETVSCGSGLVTDYTSAFIGSRDAVKYYPLYGRYEIRARIPHGQGIWPAFWLRHVNGSSAAEVDILEVFHHTDPGSLTQTLHFPNSLGTNIAKKGSYFEPAVKGTGDWHIFAVDIEQVYPGRDDTVKFSFWVDSTKTLEYTNTNAASWTGVSDKNKVWDIALNTAVGGTYAGHPDQKLGWDPASGGRCGLERPQRLTSDSASCSTERTPGKWYNDTISQAPATDGIADIWLAPWNYNGQTSADYIIDYVRYYIKN